MRKTVKSLCALPALALTLWLLHGIGGWQNCLASGCTILAVPSFRDRIPVIVDEVTTLCGPGEFPCWFTVTAHLPVRESSPKRSTTPICRAIAWVAPSTSL